MSSPAEGSLIHHSIIINYEIYIFEHSLNKRESKRPASALLCLAVSCLSKGPYSAVHCAAVPCDIYLFGLFPREESAKMIGAFFILPLQNHLPARSDLLLL